MLLQALLVNVASSVLADGISYPAVELTISSDKTAKKTIESTIYVPMGRHFKMECAAQKMALRNGQIVNGISWVFINLREKPEFESGQNHSRFEYLNGGASLRGFAVQKVHEGAYKCHVKTVDGDEWASRVWLVVQDCGTQEDELKSYKNERNPCQYGACIIEAFPNHSSFQYLKCSCVTQYTGEFCDVIVEGALVREMINFSPFAGHMLTFLCVFVFYFCCPHRDSKPKISLADEVPEMPRTTDDPKMLYPAALLPETEEEPREEELDGFAVTRLLKELQKS